MVRSCCRAIFLWKVIALAQVPWELVAVLRQGTAAVSAGTLPLRRWLRAVWRRHWWRPAQVPGVGGAGSRARWCKFKNSSEACTAFRPPVHSSGAGTPDKIKLVPLDRETCTTYSMSLLHFQPEPAPPATEISARGYKTKWLKHSHSPESPIWCFRRG